MRCRWGLFRGSTFWRPACRFRVTFFVRSLPRFRYDISERIVGHFSPFRWFERGEFLTNCRLNILLALILVPRYLLKICSQTSRFAKMHGVYSSFSCSAIFYGDCVQRGELRVIPVAKRGGVFEMVLRSNIPTTRESAEVTKSNVPVVSHI